jgi:hypothetical protein
MIFNITGAQADQILNALAAQPYRDSAGLISELVQQVQAQQVQAQKSQPAQPAFAASLNGGGEAAVTAQ